MARRSYLSYLQFKYVCSHKSSEATSFMTLPIIKNCAVYLIIDFILATAFVILGKFFDVLVLSIMIQTIAFCIHVVIELLYLIPKSMVKVTAEVKKRTEKIKQLRADSAILLQYCADEATKKEFGDFAELLRYSDPMSCEELEAIEAQIEELIQNMKNQLMSGDSETALNNCKIATKLVNERNTKCLLLK